MTAKDITPRLIGYLMMTPAAYDEEGFGDRISLWSEKDGKYVVWGKKMFDMLRQDNPKLAKAVVMLSGEWLGTMPTGNQIGNEKLRDTLQTLEYTPWVDNNDESGIGLTLLIEWGRFILKNKDIYENVQKQIKDFLEDIVETENYDEEDLEDDWDRFNEEWFQKMWSSREDFIESANLFINTKWEDVPQHGNPKKNDEPVNYKTLNYPEQPEPDEEDNFEPYGEPDEDEDFSGTSALLGGGSRMANDVLKALSDSGAQIMGVAPGGGIGRVGVSNSNNIKKQNDENGRDDLFFIDSIYINPGRKEADVCLIGTVDDPTVGMPIPINVHIKDLKELNGAEEGDYVIYKESTGKFTLANDELYAKQMQDDWSKLSSELIAQSQNFVDPLSKNIESKNSKSGAFDKQKNWKDIPDFDPSHVVRKPKKQDDEDFDFDEDEFKKDLKSLLGDDDD